MENFRFSDDQIEQLIDLLERYNFSSDKINKFIVEVQSAISQSQVLVSAEQVKESRNYLFDFEDQVKKTHRMLLQMINEGILSESSYDRIEGEKAAESLDPLLLMDNHRENLESLIADIEQLTGILEIEKPSEKPSQEAFYKNTVIAFKRYLGYPSNNRGALIETIEEICAILDLPNKDVARQIKHLLESI